MTVNHKINSMEDLNDLPLVEDEKPKFDMEKHLKAVDEMMKPDVETISITDEHGKEYKFKDASSFTYELYTIKSRYGGNPSKMIGSVYSKKEWIACTWDLDGKDRTYWCYNLTPIKPKWHEDEGNFPCIMIKHSDGKSSRDWIICRTKQHYENIYRNSKWKLATKAEIDSLYYEDKDLLSEGE